MLWSIATAISPQNNVALPVYAAFAKCSVAPA
jgi:hypothetical protein